MLAGQNNWKNLIYQFMLLFHNRKVNNMKTNIKIYLSGALTFMLLAVTSHAIIEQETVSAGLSDEYFAIGTSDRLPLGTGSGVSFHGDWSVHDWGITLTAINGTMGIQYFFVEMGYGDLVNSASIFAVLNPFASAKHDEPFIWGSLDIPLDTSIYLGFQLGGNYDPIQFGWVELFYDGDTVQALNSATDRDGIGIYVGKYETAAIPEPSTLLLLLIGAPFLRRRKQSG